MRVLLGVNMEGVSQISDYRQLWADFPDFWEAGQAATTIDVVAAVNGLRSAGVTEITFCNLHEPPCSEIIDFSGLPDDVTVATRDDVFRESVIPSNFDALFMLGWQARCGTPDGFMSSTEGINLRVSVDGNPVTAVHTFGWRAGVPVIGVTGDAALESQLNGSLEGVPFLNVKHANQRSEATPEFPPKDGAKAIQTFATWCASHIHDRVRPELPDRFVLSMSMRPEYTDIVDGVHGLRRTSPGVVARSITDWWYEAEPAIAATVEASRSPLIAAGDNTSKRQTLLETWANANEPPWII